MSGREAAGPESLSNKEYRRSRVLEQREPDRAELMSPFVAGQPSHDQGRVGYSLDERVRALRDEQRVGRDADRFWRSKEARASILLRSRPSPFDRCPTPASCNRDSCALHIHAATSIEASLQS